MAICLSSLIDFNEQEDLATFSNGDPYQQKADKNGEADVICDDVEAEGWQHRSGPTAERMLVSVLTETPNEVATTAGQPVGGGYDHRQPTDGPSDGVAKSRPG
jgi:hypothetical protein